MKTPQTIEEGTEKPPAFLLEKQGVFQYPPSCLDGVFCCLMLKGDIKAILKYSVYINYCNIDNIFVASVPELQGCMAHGDTREEALKEIMVAMELWLEVANELSDVIPEPIVRT